MVPTAPPTPKPTRALARSPWTEAGAGAVAFGVAMAVLHVDSPRLAMAHAPLLAIAACAALGVATVTRRACRRAEQGDARALDAAHRGIEIAALTSLLTGLATVSFMPRGHWQFYGGLSVTIWFWVPLLLMLVGWALLAVVLVTDARRLAWLRAVRADQAPGLAIVNRELDVPALFAGEAHDASTIVVAGAEDFRSPTIALARVTTGEAPVRRVRQRRVVAVLAAAVTSCVVYATVSFTGTLGVPHALAVACSPDAELDFIGRYAFLDAAGLSAWAVRGPNDDYRVVAISKADGHLMSGPELFLAVACDRAPSEGPGQPVNDPAVRCARWASDTLSGSEMLLSSASIRDRRLTFDGVAFAAHRQRPAQRECFAVDLDTAVMGSWSADADGTCR